MRTYLLLIIAWIVSHLAAIEVTIGDATLRIPTDELHQEIMQESQFVSAVRSVLPPGMRVLYAEAPTAEALKANAGEKIQLSTCHLLMALGELENETYTHEDFIDTKQALVDGLKEGLKGASLDEAMDLMKRTIAQKNQIEIAIETPTLVGEPEVTDDHVRFTMLMAVIVDGRKITQVIRGTMRTIQDRLVIVYTYQHVLGEDSIERASLSHAAFVERLVRANSLVLPSDLATPTVDDAASAPDKQTDVAPAPEKKPAAASAIIP